jgi:hypothetical protein
MEEANPVTAVDKNAIDRAYVAPIVRVMSESEVLSAFQVNAAPTMGWWVA